MINPLSNTPANGDFARYVEELSARASVQRQENEADYEMDAGITEHPHEVDSHSKPASAFTATPGLQVAPPTRSLGGFSTVFWVFWVLLLLVLLSVGVQWLTLVILFVVGSVIANVVGAVLRKTTGGARALAPELQELLRARASVVQRLRDAPPGQSQKSRQPRQPPP